MRIAYLVNFEPGPTTDALNAIRWLAAPGPRRPAHITLRGPYDLPEGAHPRRTRTHPAPRKTDRLLGSTVQLSGVGMFRGRHRRTLFLHGLSDLLEELGNAPDRPYHPHVTLYSGSDVEFATSIKPFLEAAPELTVIVAEIERVVVGQVERPLDRSVLDESPARDWLQAVSLADRAFRRDDRDDRRRGIDAIVQGLRYASDEINLAPGGS